MIGEIYFKNLNNSVEFSMGEVLKNEISGVYENPMDRGDVIVISFQDSDNLELNHQEISLNLKKAGKYNKKTYKEHTDSELNKMEEGSGSFYSVTKKEDIDYNFISISSFEIMRDVDWSQDLNFSSKMKELLPYSILFHEMAHSHDHREKANYEVRDSLTKVFGKRKENEIINLYKLGEENYADSNMFLQMGKMLKQKSPETARKDIQELEFFYMLALRVDFIEKNNFDAHTTRATIKTTMDFIEEHWVILEQLTNKDMEKISASITNGTLNNPLINKKVNSLKAQKELAKNGGLQQEILVKVSKKVNDKLKEMINVEIDSDGNGTFVFEYKANAHNKYNEKQSNKFGRGRG